MLREAPSGFSGSYGLILMNMIWVAILTLIVGGLDGSCGRLASDRGCLAVKPAHKSPAKGACRAGTIARRVDGRSTVPPWSSPVIEDCDTPEVDETWMVDHDAATSIPVAWVSWARPCSSTVFALSFHSHRSAIVSVPLRC